LADLKLFGDVPGVAVKKLAAADWFPGLRSLTIGSSRMSDAGVRAMKSAPHLRSLVLHGETLKGVEFEVIATAFPELRSLELRVDAECEDAPSATERFLARLSTPHLRHLTLGGVGLPPLAARALAGNPAFSNLTLLRLENAEMTAEGVEALLTSPHLQRLIRLDFLGQFTTSRTTGGEGLAAMLDPAVLPNLVSCGMPNGVPDGLRAKLEAARPGLRLA
jgi:hypothetical protein